MLTFFQSLGISMGICAISSLLVFFAKTVRMFVSGAVFFLAGVLFSLIQTDVFAGTKDGKIAACAILSAFIFEGIALRFIRHPKNSLFYVLPFLAFITLAISTNLMTLLLGLVLFDLAFILLEKQRDSTHLNDCAYKMNIGLLTFAYGISVIFSRLGSLSLSNLRLQLSINADDEWLMFGFGLLVLSVIIQLYGILLSIKKEHL